jgi:protein-tyrosine phosphatase
MMLTRQYWITEYLATQPRPAGGENLPTEIEAWAKQDIKIVVSLLTPSENKELGLEQEQRICEEKGITFLCFPIEDLQLPESFLAIKKLAEMLQNTLSEAQKVIIHCRAGIGRATILASCVLIVSGFSAQKALNTIGQARGVTVPDTQAQKAWIEKFSEKFGK